LCACRHPSLDRRYQAQLGYTKKHESKASQIRDIDRISLRHPAKDVVAKKQEITVYTTSQSGTYEITSHP